MKATLPLYVQSVHGDYTKYLEATAPLLEQLAKEADRSPLPPAPSCRKCGEPLPPGFRVRCAECAEE